MLDTACRGHEVEVIGMGAFSPIGSNCTEMRQALLDGRDSIARVTHFDATRFVGELASSFGGDLPVEAEAGARSWMDRATLLTVEAYREAVRQAGVDPRNLDPERVGVCLGSSHSGLVRTEEVAQHVLGGRWVCNGRKSDHPLTAILAASQRGIRDLHEGMLTRIDRNPVLIAQK